MDKKISSRLAIEIILLVTVAVVLVVMLQYYSFSGTMDDVSLFSPVKHGKKIANNDSSCRLHAYKGEVPVKVWPLEDGLFQVASDDTPKLPYLKENSPEENSKIKVIDMPAETADKIKLASADKPEEITLTGFAIRCHQPSLASLNYQDGIFRRYLNN